MSVPVIHLEITDGTQWIHGELGLGYTPFPRSRFGFQVSVWISVLCPAGLEMLGNPPFPSTQLRVGGLAGGRALLCIIEGSFLLGTGASLQPLGSRSENLLRHGTGEGVLLIEGTLFCLHL